MSALPETLETWDDLEALAIWLGFLGLGDFLVCGPLPWESE